MSSDGQRALFFVRGGRLAQKTVEAALEEFQAAKYDVAVSHDSAALSVKTYLVTGEPDVVVDCTGPEVDLERLFLGVTERLAGHAVVAGQPVSVIPNFVTACYLHENTVCEKGAGNEPSSPGALIEVDVKRATDDGAENLESVAASLLSLLNTKSCVLKVTSRDRLIVEYDSPMPADLAAVVAHLGSLEAVVASRTRLVLAHSLHLARDKPRTDVSGGLRPRALGVDTFMFMATGRTTADALERQIDKERDCAAHRVYGQADLILRASASVAEGVLLRIAAGAYLLGKQYRGPERLRVLRVERKIEPRLPAKHKRVRATVTIDVKGKGKSERQSLVESLSKADNPVKVLTYLGEVANLNVIIAQFAFGSAKSAETWIQKTIVSGDRKELVRTTTTYWHLSDLDGAKTGLASVVHAFLQGEGQTRDQILAQCAEPDNPDRIRSKITAHINAYIANGTYEERDNKIFLKESNSRSR